MDDTAAVLNGGGESAAPEEPHTLPAGLLQRKLDKEKKEKELAIKQKELLQKQLDEMATSWNWQRQMFGTLCPLLPPCPQGSFELLCSVYNLPDQ